MSGTGTTHNKMQNPQQTSGSGAFLTTRMVTAFAIAALALSWHFLPDFTQVIMGYIGL